MRGAAGALSHDLDARDLMRCCLGFVCPAPFAASERFAGCRQAASRRLEVSGWVEAIKLIRAISTAQLHALLRFHMPPIDVVVFHGSQAKPGFEGGFPLRCLQRLSRPHLATLLCRWRDNRSTRGASIPVLSY